MAKLPFDVDSLENTKRSELQKLCKQFGIKANRKTAQLIEDLKTYADIQGREEKIKSPVSLNQNCVEHCTPESKVSSESCEKKSSGKKYGNSTSRKRKRTYSIDKTTDDETVESEKDNNEIDSQEADDEYRKNLLEHLERTAEQKVDRKNECKIPKLAIVGVCMPIHPASETPDSNFKSWEKIHKTQFDRMDSLDDYLEKRRKRTEYLHQSVKKAKLVVDDAKSAVESLQQHKTPYDKKRRSTKLRKPQIQTSNIFKSLNDKTVNKDPEVFNFSQVFQFKGNEPPKPKPSARKSTSVVSNVSNATVIKVSDSENKSKTPYSNRKSTADGLTPFRFSASVNSPQPETPGKRFDLQASLKKPLKYKPYTGKLKIPPYVNKKVEEKNKPKCNPYKEAAQKIQERLKTTRTDVKNVRITSRNERRKEVVKKRASKRDNAMMARRGINV